ncbi:MAG: hypothetical protein AAB131_12450 [Actinomycetota bacterium]
MRSRRVTLVTTALAAVLTAAACAGGSGGPTASATPVTTVPGPYDYEYVIPEGTAYLISAGEDPGVMPASLDVRLGETIRIVNDDVQSHTIGTFYVLAGTTLTYRFAAAGVFEGVCSTNPTDTFILTVTE